MSSYAVGDLEAIGIVKDMMQKHHNDLHVQGVTVQVIFAYSPRTKDSDEPIGNAIKLHGYPCHAIASITPLKYRVLGVPDVQIMIDGDIWPELPAEKKNALVDHELRHFGVAKKHDGAIILDTCGRPKIKTNLHDVQFGWFADVAMRHGANSAEVEQAEKLFKEAGQIFFPFASESLGGGKKVRKTKALKGASAPAEEAEQPATDEANGD